MIPCNNCLCIGVCRNKSMNDIFRDCSLLLKWMDTKQTDPDVISKKVGEVLMHLNPHLFEEDGNDTM